MLKKNIAFIGSGAMAEAMIAGLIRQELAKPEELFAAGPRPERGEELRKKYGVKPFTDNSQAVHNADVVVLSVKPQRLTHVMKTLKGVRPDALVLSIIAGAGFKKISAGLKHNAVVRSMPNTPAQIGKGITVWTASSAVTEAQKDIAARDPFCVGRRSLRRGGKLSRHGNGSFGDRACIRFPFHGSPDRRGCAHGPAASSLRTVGGRDFARLRRVLLQSRASSGRAAESSHVTRRHIRRGVVLSRESRLPHGDLSLGVGGVSALAGIGKREAGASPRGTC